MERPSSKYLCLPMYDIQSSIVNHFLRFCGDVYQGKPIWKPPKFQSCA